MAQIGCLGDIVFQVSADTIKTINRVVLTGAARYGEHKRHLGKTLVEFTGLDAATVSFEIELSAYLGVDPNEDLDKINSYISTGKPLVLTLGDKSIGDYRWVIRSYKVKMKNYDSKGNLLSATVEIGLLEYLKS